MNFKNLYQSPRRSHKLGLLHILISLHGLIIEVLKVRYEILSLVVSHLVLFPWPEIIYDFIYFDRLRTRFLAFLNTQNLLRVVICSIDTRRSFYI
jgi:hypothetical protein